MHDLAHMMALLRAEFSLLDFKASQEANKVELPLYIIVVTEAECVICIADISALTQAEFSLLDFRAGEEATKVELPLYIELKGKRIDKGCGHLTVRARLMAEESLSPPETSV